MGKRSFSDLYWQFKLTRFFLLYFHGSILISYVTHFVCDSIEYTQKLLLAEDGEIFQLWERPPVDLFVKVYLFNITNHEEFMSGRDKKLNVEEIGPYVYQ